MTLEELLAELNLAAGPNLEVLSIAGKVRYPAAFWATLSAFANTSGGTIVLGVREVQGKCEFDFESERHVRAYLQEYWREVQFNRRVNVQLLKAADVRIERPGSSSAPLLLFSVPQAPRTLKPVYAGMDLFGKTYRREGSQNLACTAAEVRQMLFDASDTPPSEDSRILEGYSLGDLDLDTLHSFRQAFEGLHQGHPWNAESDQEFLEHVGAYRKNRATSAEGFTVAGLLMFGKTMSITSQECRPYFFPDYRERMGQGSELTSRLRPDGTWEANLYQFYAKVLPRLLQNATPGQEAALREGLANCLIHASYASAGNLTIDKDPEKIVMSNPGTMLAGPQEFKKGGHSVCRNPLLQAMFGYVGVGARAGSGGATIANGFPGAVSLEECHRPDRVEFVFRVSGAATVNIQAEGPAKVEAAQTEPPEAERNGSCTEAEAATEAKAADLTGKLAEIYGHVKGHPHTTSAEIAEVIRLSRESAKKYLQRLTALGLVTAEGANKNRTYKAS